MPGLSFVCDLKGRARTDDSAILSSLDALIHDDRYKRGVLLKDERHFLGYTAYDGYPINSFDLGDLAIHVEGRLYGGDHASEADRLRELAGCVLSEKTGLEERITAWLRETDGDFIVFMFHKETGDIGIVNDVFGRLPLYCYRTNDTLMLSRDVRFILKLINQSRFDRMAVAQHLWIGYPLGKRTLLEDVDRVAPATTIRIRARQSTIQIDTLHCFNFERKNSLGRSPHDTAAELAASFCDACAARSLPGRKNIISLSGGFDSRAVASGSHKRGIRFRATSFLDHQGTYASDVRIAGQVAGALNVPWELFRLGPPTGKEILSLLRMKNGANPLGMSFLLPFFERIRDSYGSDICFLTGDAGNQVMNDLRPSADLRNMEDLVNYLILQQDMFPLDVVMALTGVDSADFTCELRRHLASYPEEDIRQKYAHFVIYERAFNWLFEGEDRNRFYFWSTTPFTGIGFFTAALRCPDEHKSYYRLYREFLLELSPAAAAIDYAGVVAPITSDRFRAGRKALALLGDRPDQRRRVKKAVGSVRGYDNNSLVMRCLRQQIENCDCIFDYLSESAVRRIIDRWAEHTTEQIDRLFTIISALEDLTTGKSALEQYI